MELLSTILVWTAGAIAFGFLLLSIWVIYYDITRTNMAPEFDHPLKLRVAHCSLLFTLTLGEVLAKLGLCGQFAVTRFCLELTRPAIDSSLSAKDLDFDGVPVKVYQHKAPSTGKRKGFVFFHGGAGVIGNTKCYQNVCSKIAKDSGSVLVAVGYRLAPEYPYPAQQKDCYAATVHFMQNAEDYGVDPSQIIVSGDSAGGNFAAVVVQNLLERSDLPKIRAQVLIYAGLQGMDFNLPSYQHNATFPLLYRQNVVYYGLHYLGTGISLMDDVLKGSHVPDALRTKYGKWVSPENIAERFKRRGYKPVALAPFKPEVFSICSEILKASFSPMFSEDSVIRQLPETLVVSCEYDVLRDDSLLYKKRLEDNGVKVSWFHAENGFHGAINFTGIPFLTFPVGAEILDHVAEFVKRL